MKALHLISTLSILLLATLPLSAQREFDLLCYNVENLFDGDGEAEFDYYKQETGTPYAYTLRKLYTKIDNIVSVLKEFDGGKGPAIIAFQEFERDVTPPTEPHDLLEYFARFKGRSLKSMLGAGFNRVVGDLPVELLLLKHLEDEGLTGYSIAMPENHLPDREYSAHTNAIFTRFPINYVRQHQVQSARDILEVGLDIEGQQLIIFNNHWKSGASNPDTEKTRIQNATVLRERINAILASNPYADIIVTGDLNSHYNQTQVIDSISKSGINDVLKSQGNESALLTGNADLYNLWFEIPAEQRGSETYRGYWGTLMHIILSPGLYDRHGAQYVDGSFRVVRLPGVNIDEQFGQPIRWSSYGELGGGFSDHLPIVATFVANGAGLGRPGVFPEIKEPSTTALGPTEKIPVDFTLEDKQNVPMASELDSLEDYELPKHFGLPYRVREPWTSRRKDNTLGVKVGSRTIKIYAWDEAVKEALEKNRKKSRSDFYGYLEEFRGEIYFNVPAISWVE